MTLFEKLAAATSEEDVKAAYIKALGLKDVQRNLIDIQTKEVWFEAKLGAKHSTYAMFTQLLNYVWVALRDGEEIPPFLCVIDSVKAALMKTEVALPLLKDKSIAVKWGKSASDITPQARAVLDAGRAIWRTYFERFGSFDYAIREKLKLNRADVGWYQVRNALKLYAESAEGHPTDFSDFESAYKALGDKLRPKVYEYGFLRQ